MTPPKKGRAKLLPKPIDVDYIYPLWAINTRSHEGHAYIGIHWWYSDPLIEKPSWLYGTAIFTRKHEAVKRLADVREAFPRARVERITVEVRPFVAKPAPKRRRAR